MSPKKVLIITYYWPPAGGPGVQRWLKFVKYLPEYDIEPIVYCPDNPTYPILDETLINDIPTSVTIIKQPIKEPYHLANRLAGRRASKISSGIIPDKKKQSFIERAMLFVRGNFFIPDARKNWVKPSVRFLTEYIIKEKIETIITTGPPHSLHLIGLQLKAKLDITWFADFRDPWTTIGYQKALKLTKLSIAKHKELESQVLKSADAIIVTSAYTKTEFESKTARPVTLLTNGYDSHSLSVTAKDDLFTISHIGSLLSERNPIILWEVLSELKIEIKGFSNALQLNLIGVVSDAVLDSLYKHGLKPQVNLVGYVNHNEAIKFQLKSQLLLLIEIDSEITKAIIPGKIFEYLNAKTPIIALGPKDSDIEKIINKTQTGFYFNYQEKAQLKAQMIRYFEAYKTNDLDLEPRDIAQYSRKALTKRLAELINPK